MYKLLVLLLVTFCLTEHSQHAAVPEKKGVDTLFLLRKKTHESYYKVYIERNRQSASYKALLDFNMDNYDADTYREYLKDLKHRHTPGLKRYDLTGLPKQWMPVYRYKNRYYIYSPSEWGNLSRKIITDTTMVYWYMDGPTPSRLTNVKKADGCTWQFNMLNNYPPKTTGKVIVHIIDPRTKLAVWEFAQSHQPSTYGLYIPRENASNFDMVVSECLQHKTAEFQFDDIDYRALLKQR